nr:S8 family serine peptidase [bacterium]
MKKRIISLVVVAVLCAVAFSMPVTGAVEKLESKMTPLLQARLQKLRADMPVSVLVEWDGIDEEEMLPILKERYPQDAANYALVLEGGGNDLNMEQVQSIIAHKREIYQELYLLQNKEKAEEFCDESQISASAVSYISSFSPITGMELNKTQLTQLEKRNDVLAIEWNYPIEMKDQLSYMTKVSRSEYIRTNFGNRGDGVGIGQIENNVPDTSHTTELTGVNISRNSSATGIHASRVAAIMVGRNNGAAPGAKLYSASFAYSSSDQPRVIGKALKEIEWLLSRTGPSVSVINMSSDAQAPDLPEGWALSPGGYTLFAKWIDHIAMQHDVHFVVSAGNASQNAGSKVASSGMAYNAVTVGAYQVNRAMPYETTTSTFWEPGLSTEGSGYNENAGLAEKPDLVAPGVGYTVDGISGSASGTSFAAPMVSGIMAQLISCKPALALQQRALKAILLASAWCKLDSPSFVPLPGTQQMDDKQGAGKVDAKNARYTIVNNYYMQALINAGNFPYTHSFYVSSSASSARVALVWSKRNTISGSHVVSGSTAPIINDPPLSDLDLEVFNPNGTSVGYSRMRNGNVEIVQFKPTVSGTYTIRVSRHSGTNAQDSFALAWW